jgi:glycerophosphoryl diester phosphodiesterase
MSDIRFVFAYRGDTAHAPENTLAALREAYYHGADGAVVDARPAADGRAMVVADSTLDRTTSGTGPVDRVTSGQMRALDAGSWFSPPFMGERIPSLTDALAATRGRLPLAVNLPLHSTTAFADGVLDEARAQNSADDLTVVSPDAKLLAHVRQRAPETATGLLLTPQHKGVKLAAAIGGLIGIAGALAAGLPHAVGLGLGFLPHTLGVGMPHAANTFGMFLERCVPDAAAVAVGGVTAFAAARARQRFNDHRTLNAALQQPVNALIVRGMPISKGWVARAHAAGRLVMASVGNAGPTDGIARRLATVGIDGIVTSRPGAWRQPNEAQKNAALHDRAAAALSRMPGVTAVTFEESRVDFVAAVPPAPGQAPAATPAPADSPAPAPTTAPADSSAPVARPAPASAGRFVVQAESPAAAAALQRVLSPQLGPYEVEVQRPAGSDEAQPAVPANKIELVKQYSDQLLALPGVYAVLPHNTKNDTCRIMAYSDDDVAFLRQFVRPRVDGFDMSIIRVRITPGLKTKGN